MATENESALGRMQISQFRREPLIQKKKRRVVFFFNLEDLFKVSFLARATRDYLMRLPLQYP